MELRSATIEDMPVLLLIEQSCFGHERFDRGYIEELMASRDVDVHVAVVKGSVIGSVMVRHDLRLRLSNLLSLAVLPSEQGKGYSKTMLLKAEQLSKDRGSGSMRLEVREHNAPAIRLYHNAGYKVVSRLLDFFGKGEDAWLMSKDF